MDAAILAGGRARRFGGRDKGSLLVGGSSILDRQLAALGGLVDRVLVVGGEPAHFRGRPVQVVADRLPAAGALGGIYTALSEAAGDHVLVLACDLPFVSRALLGRLLELADGRHDVVVPRTPDGLQPLCAVYAHRLREAIRRQAESGRLKVKELFDPARTRELGPDELAAIDPDARLFLNVNSPGDLERAARLAAAAD